MMKSKVHAIAGVSSFLLIASFWASTAVSELFLDQEAVVSVKVAVAYALVVLIPCIAATGATGFSMGGKSTQPMVIRKRRRMPLIALNGMFVLLPAALYLSAKAQSGAFDTGFYIVQGIELLAGAINLLLMGRNIRDGRQLHRRRAENR
jgi:hypothetical protein